MPEDFRGYDAGRANFEQDRADEINKEARIDREQVLVDALKDIKMGAEIMLQVRTGKAIDRYAEQNLKVADAALANLRASASMDAFNAGKGDADAGLPFRAGRFKDPRLQEQYQRGYASVIA
jgi:hypothetical protein